MKQRIVWVDYVKVICIFLMVACHVGQKFFDPTWVYQFHMPAFFVVSGFLFKPKSAHQTSKAFVIPVLFCSIINAAYGLSPDIYRFAIGQVGIEEWGG